MSISGFKVIPVKFSSSSSSCHELYIKEHSIKIREELKPQGQTLFVLNVPPYATETNLAHAFLSAGKIIRVILEKGEESQDGFQKAFVVFSKREYLLKALNLGTLKPLSSSEVPLKVGLEKWVEDYNKSICNPAELQKTIVQYMAKYDKKEQLEKTADVVDDEGWTLVTKGSRRPGLARKESLDAKLKEKIKKGSKKKELKNFYTFQIRESQMKHIATLRKNFEEAKKKVNLMKQARKFKPY